MPAPFVAAGAVQLTAPLPLRASPDPRRGAVGAPITIAADSADAADVPAFERAATLNVYAAPFCRPPTICVVLRELNTRGEPGLPARKGLTTYAVIAALPGRPGASQCTRARPLSGVADGVRGAEGGVPAAGDGASVPTSVAVATATTTATDHAARFIREPDRSGPPISFPHVETASTLGHAFRAVDGACGPTRAARNLSTTGAASTPGVRRRRRRTPRRCAGRWRDRRRRGGRRSPRRRNR